MKKKKKEEIPELPQIRLGEVVEHENGSATMSFETNKAFDNFYKEQTGRKRVSKKGLQAFILNMLEKGHDEEEGWSIRKLKE